MIRVVTGLKWLVVFLMLLTPKAYAQDISYNYVQFTYISDTIDFGESVDEVEGSGIGLTLSLGFSPTFAMRLAVASTSLDSFQGIKVDDSKVTTLGVTAHTSVFDNTNIYAIISALKAEFTVIDGMNTLSDSDIGGEIEAGLRHMFSDIFEIELRASYTSVFGEKQNAHGVDARLYVWNSLSIGLGYDVSDDGHALLLATRMDI